MRLKFSRSLVRSRLTPLIFGVRAPSGRLAEIQADNFVRALGEPPRQTQSRGEGRGGGGSDGMLANRNSATTQDREEHKKEDCVVVTREA